MHTFSGTHPRRCVPLFVFHLLIISAFVIRHPEHERSQPHQRPSEGTSATIHRRINNHPKAFQRLFAQAFTSSQRTARDYTHKVDHHGGPPHANVRIGRCEYTLRPSRTFARGYTYVRVMPCVYSCNATRLSAQMTMSAPPQLT